MEGAGGAGQAEENVFSWSRCGSYPTTVAQNTSEARIDHENSKKELRKIIYQNNLKKSSHES